MLYANFQETPIDAVESIKHLITGKRVYDLGGGEGNFALAMKLYAKEVFNVEIEPELYRKSRVAAIASDIMTVPLTCDVIYTFLSFFGMYALTQRLKKENWHGTLITQYYPMHNSLLDILPPDETIHCDLETHKILFLVYHL